MISFKEKSQNKTCTLNQIKRASGWRKDTQSFPLPAGARFQICIFPIRFAEALWGYS